MDLNEISEFLKQDGGKFIIVENGKPSLVIMGFDEYKNRIAKKSISGFKTPQDNEKPAEIMSHEDLGAAADEVNIDDLPL